jgi:hypothetical protein
VAAWPLLGTVEAWLFAKDKGGWQLGLTARTARGRSGCLAIAIDSRGTDRMQHVSKRFCGSLACCKQEQPEAEEAAWPLLVTVEAWLFAKDKGGNNIHRKGDATRQLYA